MRVMRLVLRRILRHEVLILVAFSCFSFSTLSSLSAEPDIDFPEGYGKTNEVFVGSPDRTILIIQDAHRNFECQSNTVEILNSIETRQNIPLLCLEGAEGGFLTNLFSKLSNRTLNQEVAQHFLKAGRITSPEYFAIASEAGLDAELYGVEDRALYLENLETFKKAYGAIQEFGPSIHEMRETVDQLKKKIYSVPLNTLDDLRSNYQTGNLSFKEYFKKLVELIADAELEKFPQLKAQKETYDLESQINIQLLGQERGSLVNAISQKVPPSSLSTLLSESLQFRMNRVSALRFHELLAKLANEFEVPLEETSQVGLYLKYIRKIHEVSEPALFRELGVWIGGYEERLIKNSDERKLKVVDEKLAFIERLFGLRISNEDFDQYEANSNDFLPEEVVEPLKALAESKETALFIPSDFMRLKEVLGVFGSFYRGALKRDSVMFENTLKKMEEKKSPFAVLIVGGFHTRGMTKSLKEKGISYRLVTPKVSLRNSQTPYFALLMNQKSDFERWFEPQVPLAIEPPRALAEIPLSYLDVQLLVLRQYAAFVAGGELAQDVTGAGLSEDAKQKATADTQDLLDSAQPENFKVDVNRAFSPRAGVVQIPVSYRNAKQEVVHAYLLVSRVENESTLSNFVGARGFETRSRDTFKVGGADVHSIIVEADPSYELAMREARNQDLASSLSALKITEPTRAAVALMTELAFGERSISQIETILNRKLTSLEALDLVRAIHASARMPGDFRIARDLLNDLKKREGLEPEELAAVEEGIEVAGLQARAAEEAGKLIAYPAEVANVKPEPKVYAIDISTIYEFKTDEDGKVTAKLKSPDAARRVRALMEEGAKEGRKSVVITSMTSGVGKEEMKALLERLGLVFPDELLIDVETLAKAVNEDERVFNRNKTADVTDELAGRIMQTLVGLIKNATGAEDEDQIALVGTDERILKAKLAGVVAVVITHQEGKITSFDEAIAMVQYASNFYEGEPPEEILSALERQLGTLGWDRAKITQELRKAQTETLQAPPHATDSKEYLNDVDEMEEFVVGHAA